MGINHGVPAACALEEAAAKLVALPRDVLDVVHARPQKRIDLVLEFVG
jgi:hypothetical protein